MIKKELWERCHWENPNNYNQQNTIDPEYYLYDYVSFVYMNEVVEGKVVDNPLKKNEEYGLTYEYLFVEDKEGDVNPYFVGLVEDIKVEKK